LTVNAPAFFSDEPFVDLEWYYLDNGFRSGPDMDKEHEPILRLAAETLAHLTGNVLDLGCGNGVLLKKICHSNYDLVPWGVDRSRDAIAHARLLTPRYADHFILSNIFHDCAVWSNDLRFEFVILMLGRIAEAPPALAEKLLRRIKGSATNLLVYAYDAVLHQHRSLDDLARKTGVSLCDQRLVENAAMVNMDEL
jgi:SAM-dependent methyltransferase